MSAAETLKLEDFFVEYHDIFAKHRFDVGYITELKIKLQPAHQFPVCVQGLPALIHMRDELSVELALIQNFNIITTWSHSKFSSPIFVNCKPFAKHVLTSRSFRSIIHLALKLIKTKPFICFLLQ